jgi:large subunit ribosomal protein L3
MSRHPPTRPAWLHRPQGCVDEFGLYGHDEEGVRAMAATAKPLANTTAGKSAPDKPGRKGLLGRKVGMTQIFDSAGAVVPVTVIEAGPCRVLVVRSADRDGYSAVQLGFLDKPRRLASRSVRGQVAKLDSQRAKRRAEAGVAVLAKPDCEPQRFVKEFRGVYDGVEVGQVLTVDVFEGVEFVDITGTTKGRGTAGVMKRHGFKGQRASHGVKKVHRHQGGTSMNTSPARVFKGKRMAGRYGNERSTMRNVKLVGFDKERNLLLVRGAVPGPNGAYVMVRQTNKIKRIGVAAPTGKKKGGK